MSSVITGFSNLFFWPSLDFATHGIKNVLLNYRDGGSSGVLFQFTPNFIGSGGQKSALPLLCNRGRRFIAGASYGGLIDKNSLNECRSCRLTKGTNLYNSLHEQALPIVAPADPDIMNRPNSSKTHRLSYKHHLHNIRPQQPARGCMPYITWDRPERF